MFLMRLPIGMSALADLYALRGISPIAPARSIGPGAAKTYTKENGFRTGKNYPFSSARQNARYERQSAAGKLSFNT